MIIKRTLAGYGAYVPPVDDIAESERTMGAYLETDTGGPFETEVEARRWVEERTAQYRRNSYRVNESRLEYSEGRGYDVVMDVTKQTAAASSKKWWWIAGTALAVGAVGMVAYFGKKGKK